MDRESENARTRTREREYTHFRVATPCTPICPENIHPTPYFRVEYTPYTLFPYKIYSLQNILLLYTLKK